MMAITNNALKGMIDRDLSRAQMTQGQLAAALSVNATPLTGQAISLWKMRGRMPRRRLPRLREVLGPHSEIAKTPDDLLCGFGPHDRVQDVFPSLAAEPVRMATVLPDAMDDAHASTESNFLAEFLPESLRIHTGRVDRLGPLIVYRPTYRSERLIAMVQRSDVPIDSAAFTLMVLGRVYANMPLFLILIQPEGSADPVKARIETSFLGLGFEVVKSESAAAECLATLEKRFS